MEEIKDLGGLVNQDLAFTKLPPGAVYDSENFRIVTTEGASTGARENIKGTVQVAGLTSTDCIQVFTFDLGVKTLLKRNVSYIIRVVVDGIPATPFTYTYTGIPDDFINAFGIYIADLAGVDIVNVVFSNTGFTITSPVCKSFTNLQVEEEVPPTPQANDTYYYKLMDDEFAYPYTGNTGNPSTDTYPIDPSTGLPLAYEPWNYVIGGHTNTGTTNGNFPPSFSYVTGASTGIPALASFPTLLEYEDINATGNIRTIRFVGLTQNANSGSTPFTFWTPATFPINPHQAQFSYYFQNTDIFTGAVPLTSATLKVWLNCGPNLSAIAGLTESTNVFGSTRNAVKLFDIDLLVAGNRSRLGPGTGPTQNVISNYSFPSSLASLNGEVPFELIIEVKIERDTGATPPNTQWDIQFYFDYLKLLGPSPINSLPSNLLTVNTISANSVGGNIIGWTNLRDKIYLFTTDGTYDPDDPTTWGGPTPPVTNDQIIEFTYDKTGDFSSPTIVPNNFASPLYGLKPVYSGNLGFTVRRPIANPGMVEARYESPTIQKIYWTDNFNPPRQINVADPNVASLTPTDLNLQAALSMDMPFITQVIDGGALKVGVYQVAYRLKNVNGAESRFSRTSQLVPIIDATESTVNVSTYFPGKAVGDNANKSIRVKVNNIDTTYSTIEFVTLYFADSSSVPEINIVKESFISANGKADVIITGAEDAIPITLEEFTAFNNVITRAKTLAAKKQTLFLGNITTGEQIVNWDSRAYRFPANSNITYVRDLNTAPATFTEIEYIPGTNSFEYNNVPGSTVPVDADCSQPYSLQSPNVVTTPNAYLYQPGTTILGGQGPNVKYEFITENILLDFKNDPSGSQGVSGPHMLPGDNWITNVNLENDWFVADGVSLSNNGSPYVYGMLAGYRRDEMYRFGIVFYDELDNPTYVNWIADIRMPHAFMPDNAVGDVAGTSVAAFPGSGTNRSRIGSTTLTSSFSSDPIFYDNSNTDLWGRILGIKFTIDFSGVPDKYKKASIVRCPLKETDKHVLAQGLLLPTFKFYGSMTGPGYDTTTSIFTEYSTPVANLNTSVGSYNDTWFDAWTFRSPEFLFKAFPGRTGSDAIDIVNFLDIADRDYLMVKQSGVNGDYFQADLSTGVTYDTSDKKIWVAWRTKFYKSYETATIPNSMKNNATSQNPYPVVQAFSYLGGGNARAYKKGDTLSTVPGQVIRSVFACNPRDINGGAGGGNSYPGLDFGFSYGNNALFVQLAQGPAANWNSTPAGNGYLNSDTWVQAALPSSHRQYLANYIREAPAAFGGDSYFARSNSEYIPCNNLIDISNKTAPISTRVFGGDTTVGVLDYVIQFFDRGEGAKYGNSTVRLLFQMAYIPVETSIAVNYRRSYNNTKTIDHLSAVTNRVKWLDYLYDNNSANWYTGNPKIEVEEVFNVDPVFNYSEKSVYRYFAVPALNVPAKTYDCRVWRSEKKTDGELVESWSIFRPLAYLDVESAYGPVNNLVVFQDKLYYFQDRGFGVLQVADQKLITDASGEADLVLGNSGLLERYDYISTKTGTKHQFSMHVSDYSMVWFDILARKMYRYKPGALEPLSDVKGLNAYLYERTKNDLQMWDNPYIFRGIHSTYDYRYNEFYMTFLNKTTDFNVESAGDGTLQFTLVYNDLMDGYVGRYTHHPKVYINDKVNIFSTLGEYNNDGIFMHNVGLYGVFYYNTLAVPSKLSFVVNSNPTVEKTFTNLEFVVEAFRPNTYSSESNNPLTLDPYNYKPFAETRFNDFFSRIRIYDNYQNTDWQMLGPIIRRHKTIWNVKVPTDRVINLDVLSGTPFTSGNIFNPDNLIPPGARPKFTRRLKDKWFVVDLSYSNALYRDTTKSPSVQYNNRLVAYTAKAIYTPNSR